MRETLRMLWTSNLSMIAKLNLVPVLIIQRAQLWWWFRQNRQAGFGAGLRALNRIAPAEMKLMDAAPREMGKARSVLIAQRRATRIRQLSQFIPKSYREGFLGDLLEDAAEWAEQGMSRPRIWWRVGVQVFIAVLNRPLLWKTAVGAWLVTKLKPLIGGE